MRALRFIFGGGSTAEPLGHRLAGVLAALTVPLGRGGILGVMALLRKARRGADMVAAIDVEVLVIDRAEPLIPD